ncbi:MAG: hypothetical protein WKG07_27015 [Hymenobacter sp.]
MSGQFLNRGYTNRSFDDTAPLIYLGSELPTKAPGLYLAPPVSGADPTEQTAGRDLKAQDDALVADRGFDRRDIRVGQSGLAQLRRRCFNGAYRLRPGLRSIFLRRGLVPHRQRGPGFNRLPNQPTQSDLNLFPNGFLPFINTVINDQSGTSGLRTNRWAALPWT